MRKIGIDMKAICVAFTKILLLGQIHVDITDTHTHTQGKTCTYKHTIQYNIHVHRNSHTNFLLDYDNFFVTRYHL